MQEKIKKYKIEDIFEKILNNIRITNEEAIKLYNIPDPLILGYLANLKRENLHGKKTTYVLNQHINYTNICVNQCKFCVFSRKRGEKGSFELTLEDIEKKIKDLPLTIKEIHIVGGCHPDFPFSYYVEMLKLIRRLLPQATLKCFTAVEIDHLSKISGLGVDEVLIELKKAGLDMMPGGGAEIFDPEIRNKICPEKISGTRWLKIMEIAHSLGIKTNCTMLFGHIESFVHRIDHLDKLRRLQDKTSGFVCFIPLPFLPKNSKIKVKKSVLGIEALKTIAISRLMLDNIPHIKSYWVMLGIKLAQSALYFGADDFDGTVIEEKIGHMAGARSPNVLTKKELIEMIEGCGLIPVERDGMFNILSN